MEADYLTKGKMPLLNAPGASYSGLLVSTYNSTIDDIESVFMQGHFSQTVPSLNFGTQNQIRIDNSLYLYTTELFLELYPEISAADNRNPNSGQATDCLQSDTFVPDGWGYNAIDYIEYTIGSSNTIQRISGEANWMMVAAQCRNAQHRTEMWQLGGTFTNPAVGAGQAQPAIRAYVMLTVPWSRACDNLPYPADIVTNPINIIIKFKSQSSIVLGKGVKRTDFSQAIVTARQAQVDRSKSIRNLMAADSSLVYSYPATSVKQYSITGIQGSTKPSTQVSVQIQNIENADLLGIAFYLVRDIDVTGGANLNPSQPAVQPNVWNTAEITNIDLMYNGNFLYRSNNQGQMFKLANMDGPQEKSSWENSIVLDSANSPWNTYKKDCYFTYIDFSRYRAACLPMDIPNVPRYPSQQFQVFFSTPTTETYTLVYAYFYTAMISAQGGVTTFYTA